MRFCVCALLSLLLASCGGGGSNPLPQSAAAPVSNIATTTPGTSSVPPMTPASAAILAVPHIILIIEENRSFSTVYPNGMPWLSALGDANGIAMNYVSNERGSLLDYLWLSSGSGEHAFSCDGYACGQPITSDNIFRELNKANLSWKVYAESLPGAGFMGASSGRYVKRHNPAVWYNDVINSTAQQQNVVPLTQLATDLNANNLPNYSIIVPDLDDDAHDGTAATADSWLRQHVGPVLSSTYFQPGGDGVLFITFDNGDSDFAGQVLTAVVGPRVVPGVKVYTAFRHENTLRTIMGLFGLQPFSAISTVAEMKEFFH